MAVSPTVRINVSGARGESQADILRRTGRYGVLPTDTDDEAMGKLNAAAENSAAAAEGAAGINEYDSIAEGEATTPAGGRFSVRTEEPGVVLVYERTVAGSTFIRTVLSGEILGSSEENRGGDLIGYHEIFTPYPAPAYAKTLSEIANGSTVSIARFLPKAQITAVMDQTSTYDADDDLTTALTCGAKRIDLAGGFLNLADESADRRIRTACGVRNGTMRLRGDVSGLDIGDINLSSPEDVKHPLIEDLTFIADMDPSVEPLNGVSPPLYLNNYAIRYANGRYGGTVAGVRAENVGIVVFFPDVGADTSSQLGQNSSRMILDKIRYENCGYFVKGERQTNRKYGPGDLMIVNPIGRAAIRHVELLGVDGLELIAPKFFTVGFNDTSPLGMWRKARKQEIVYVNTGNFVNLIGGKYFEAGYEAIFLDQCNEFLVANTQISWPGQRRPSSGIKIDRGWWYFEEGSFVQRDTRNAGSIVGNRIAYPTRHGIECQSTTRDAGTNPSAITANVLVEANGVRAPGVSTYYYGTDPIPADARTVFASASTESIFVHNNPSTEGVVINLSKNGSTFGNIPSSAPIQLTATTTALYLDAGSRFQLTGAASLTVTQGMLQGGWDGAEFTIENFSTGTLNVTQGTYLKLAKGMDVNIPRYHAMKLKKCMAFDGSATIYMEVTSTSSLDNAVTAPRFGFQGFSDRTINHGTGSPEGVLTAAPGSSYFNRSGGAATTFYVKETGSGNTGWVAK